MTQPERHHRPPPPATGAKQDLRWFFDERRGDLGLKAQDYQPRGAGGVPPDEVGDRQAEAHVRATRVERRLRAMDHRLVVVLQRAFEPELPNWPIGPEHRWYETGAVAAMLVDEEDLHAGARRIAAMTDAKMLSEWRRYAGETLAAALAAYLGRVPPVVEVPLLAPPRLKVKPEPARTWVPMAEGRAAPDGVGETPADWWDRQAARRPSSSER